MRAPAKAKFGGKESGLTAPPPKGPVPKPPPPPEPAKPSSAKAVAAELAKVPTGITDPPPCPPFSGSVASEVYMTDPIWRSHFQAERRAEAAAEAAAIKERVRQDALAARIRKDAPETSTVPMPTRMMASSSTAPTLGLEATLQAEGVVPPRRWGLRHGAGSAVPAAGGSGSSAPSGARPSSAATHPAPLPVAKASEAAPDPEPTPRVPKGGVGTGTDRAESRRPHKKKRGKSKRSAEGRAPIDDADV